MRLPQPHSETLYATDEQGDLRPVGEVRTHMEHQDIAELIEAGKADEARALIEERSAKGGISGHDQQTLDALLNKTEAQPLPAEVETSADAETVLESDATS